MGMMAAAFGEQHDLVKMMAVRELNVLMSLHKFAQAGHQNFRSTSVGAHQVANAVCGHSAQHLPAFCGARIKRQSGFEQDDWLIKLKSGICLTQIIKITLIIV
jgi:hypothetical protein